MFSCCTRKKLKQDEHSSDVGVDDSHLSLNTSPVEAATVATNITASSTSCHCISRLADRWCGSTLEEMMEAEQEKSFRPIDEPPTNKFTLRNVQNTPSFLHNPFILTGYRAYFSNRLAFYSLFRWHNETINIWSHLLPVFWVFYQANNVLNHELPNAANRGMRMEGGAEDGSFPMVVATTLDYALFSFFYLALFLCFFWSSVYHCFGCTTFDMHNCLYRCDIIGILCLILGSYLPALHFAFYCDPSTALFYCVTIATLVVSLAVMFNLRLCQRRVFHNLRVAAMVATIAFAVLPTLHWCIIVRPHAFPTLDLLTFLMPLGGMLGSYAMGFVFYSKSVPEKWKPDGTFDLLFQSHNIWHCWIVAAAVIWENELKQMFLRRAMAVCMVELPEV